MQVPYSGSASMVFLAVKSSTVIKWKHFVEYLYYCSEVTDNSLFRISVLLFWWIVFSALTAAHFLIEWLGLILS